MYEKKIITPHTGHRLPLHLGGMGVLAINKIRYAVRGYREPRPFSPTEANKAIDYDRRVVDNWLDAYQEYTGKTVEGASVLELGPGADLGPACFLLDRGARQYTTVDANRLIDQTPRKFYEQLLKELRNSDEVRRELEKTLLRQDDRIKYIVDPTFTLSKLKQETFDLIVSQAAFEHFSDIEQTFRELTPLMKSGGVLIAEVDLMTHTGALRGRDPLNIYRYSNLFYRLMNFSGIPNRLRPNEYKASLERNGWKDVEITPLQTLPETYTNNISSQLAKPFRSDLADMHVLTFLLRATKA